MKRYLLFMGAAYYPGGGWDDFAGSFDTPEEAAATWNKDENDWYDIVDTIIMKKITKGDNGLYRPRE